MLLGFLTFVGLLVPSVPGSAPGPSAAAPVRAPRSEDVTIGNGEYRVTVTPWGVLSGLPPGGLVTVDGQRVHLTDRATEWFGVSFGVPGEGREAREVEAARERRETLRGVGRGKAPDWAGRPLAEVVSFSATADAAESVVRCGDLEVVTRITFDPLGTYLLASVVARNVGTGVLEDVHYSREWRVPGTRGVDLGEPPEEGALTAPADVTRYFYDELHTLGPGESRSIGWSYAPPEALTVAAGTAVEVPLALWTSTSFPTGLDLGLTCGTSFGDYDGDGWIDVVVCYEGKIWRNLGGLDWADAVDLNAFLPPAVLRYGASVGDYDADGRADIATEPRVTGQDACVHVLRNEGGGSFTNIAVDPSLMQGQSCVVDSETAIWADVDGDRDLDLFVPVYPEGFGGPGNSFFQNLGPTGPGGQYRFVERAEPVGLKNPIGSSKPEGAQACDWDSDGDLDIFSNSTFYQNVSALGAPRFGAMEGDVSGLILNQFIDEGAAFFDYDMDGDFDLFLSFISGLLGNVVLENHGDGTFFGGESGIIDNPLIGIGLGLSVADWDNDGDVDYTTREVFRRNMLVETGQRHFTVAVNDIDPSHIFSATPAWGDWDRDGDLDSALGNYGALTTGHFYDNVLYDAATPDEQRRYVRVRPVRDSASVPGGLEDEFGAAAEIRIEGDSLRRRAHVASGHGYLSQNEYALHFGLPADPLPADPEQDLELALSVDFPNLPSDGFWRVDGDVNPVLAELDLAALEDREIDVFRSGAVSINGCLLAPNPPIEPRLLTTTGGLILPGTMVPLAPPAPTATGTTWVGIELDTLGATEPVRMSELILDGELGRAVDCGGPPANVALWEVPGPSPSGASGAKAAGQGLTQLHPKNPWLQPGPLLALDAKTSPRNHRTTFNVDALLEPGKVYRLVARVKSSRGTPIAGPTASGPVRVRGGLAFDNPSPCQLDALLAAPVDPTQVYVAFRFRTEFAGPWTDVGAGQPGLLGVPKLRAVRVKEPVQAKATLELTGARPNASVIAIAGEDPLCSPFIGVPLVPSPSTVEFATTDANGRALITVSEPLAKNSFFQVGVLDDAAPTGLAVSNCLVRRGP